jgi:hypothetical protein
MKAFMTVNAFVKELESSSEIGRPIVMEAWHISTILCKPISPIAVVDRLDEDQQELMIEWLRALS